MLDEQRWWSSYGQFTRTFESTDPGCEHPKVLHSPSLRYVNTKNCIVWIGRSGVFSVGIDWCTISRRRKKTSAIFYADLVGPVRAASNASDAVAVDRLITHIGQVYFSNLTCVVCSQGTVFRSGEQFGRVWIPAEVWIAIIFDREVGHSKCEQHVWWQSTVFTPISSFQTHVSCWSSHSRLRAVRALFKYSQRPHWLMAACDTRKAEAATTSVKLQEAMSRPTSCANIPSHLSTYHGLRNDAHFAVVDTTHLASCKAT